MSNANVDIVKAYLDAAGRQDLPAMRSAFAENFTYRVPGRGPLAGVTTGPDAAPGYFTAIMQLTDGSYAIDEVVDWLSSDTRVALVAKESARRNGQGVSWTRVVLFTFAAGKIVEAALFDDDLYGLDAVLAG